MQVIFYNCGDPTIKIDKTLGDPVGSTNVSPNPTGPVNVVNPVLVVDKDQVPASTNYCHIPAYGRYYFITSIDWTVAKTAVISCHCDVLSTFGDKVKGATLNYISGAADVNEIEDGSYPIGDYLQRERFNFEGWNSGYFTDNSDGKRYLLRVADGAETQKLTYAQVPINSQILYKNLLFTVSGQDVRSCYLSDPTEIPLPPATAYPSVADGAEFLVTQTSGQNTISALYTFHVYPQFQAETVYSIVLNDIGGWALN